MTNYIKQLKASIAKAEEFIEKYGEKLAKTARTSLHVSDSSVSIYSNREDAAILGEVFGKHSWVRKLAYSGATFDWKRVIDDIGVTISDAEECEMNGSPVPEKAFPILLTEQGGGYAIDTEKEEE